MSQTRNWAPCRYEEIVQCADAMEELDEGLEDELPELPQQPANSAATSTSARVRTKVFLGKIQTPFRLPADAGRRAGRSL